MIVYAIKLLKLGQRKEQWEKESMLLQGYTIQRTLRTTMLIN